VSINILSSNSVFLVSLLPFHRKMINLFKIKVQKKEDATSTNGKPAAKK
jgi:hypothetical protein